MDLGLKRTGMKRVALCLALAMAALALAAPAARAEERIPRVMYIGDSWTGFLWAFRTLRDVLPEYNGLERWIEVGARTAVMGSKTFEWLTPARLAVVDEELALNPNVDVVVVTLGGNDFSSGTKNVLPWNMGREVDFYDWYYEQRDVIDRNFNEDWEAWRTWYQTGANHAEDFAYKACVNPPADGCWGSAPGYGSDLLMNKVKGELKLLVRHILDVRPDIRVVIVGYDYICRWPKSRMPQNVNGVRAQSEGLFAMERTKFEIAQELDSEGYAGRIRFVQNLGVMQHTFGYYKGNERAQEPWHGVADPVVAPGVAPMPGSGDTWFVGGDPDCLSPLDSYIDYDIHLTAGGYEIIARRFLDDCVAEWLNYPKVLAILPNEGKSPLLTFSVTFSHPVTGVDASDFEVFLGPNKAMSIVGVAGSGDSYVVTADADGASGDVLIRVVDDGSIVREDNGVQLGGPGVGNGLFEFNGTYEYADITRPGDDNFAEALNYLYLNSRAYEDLLQGFSFNPVRFDANGNFLLEGSIDDPIVIPGNNMLDVFEFTLIEYCTANPGINYGAQGGIVAADIAAAWQNNITEMQTVLGGAGGLVDLILPGLDTVMAGYMTLGDPNSLILPTVLVPLLADLKDQGFPVEIGTLVQSKFIMFPALLAKTADADKDGWTNEQEYAYFACEGAGAYAAAACNAAVQPKTGAGTYERDDPARIAMLSTGAQSPAWDSTYQWHLNGAPLADDGNVNGSATRCLNILAMTPELTGNYTCAYQAPGSPDPKVRVPVTYGPVYVKGVEALPAAGGLGLGALALATALGGLAALRRKK